MRTLRILSLITVLALAALGVGARPAPFAQAQAGDPCVAQAQQALADARTACAELAPGELCYGAGTVTAAGGALAAPGDRIALADLAALSTAPAADAAAGWGLAVFELPAEQGGMTGVLFGDAQLARPAASVEPAALAVRNAGGVPINLRSGPGTNYGAVGQLTGGAEAAADGRNDLGDWLHLQAGDLAAWAFAPLLTWEGGAGAITALTVRADDGSAPAQAAPGASAFVLTTGDAPCPAAPAGLLLQHDGDPASLTVNGMTLEIARGTVLLSARPGEALEVRALDGSAAVRSRGASRELAAGGGLRVTLGGADGLTAQGTPQPTLDFAFPTAAAAPLDLLPAAPACLVGLPQAGAEVTLRVGPGEQRGILARMRADQGYAVTGWANDGAGAPWYQLDTGVQASWAARSDVAAIGACDAVAEVEAPPVVFAAPAAPPPGEPGTAPDVADFSPAAQSVWQMIPGSDNMTGECSGAPAINFCDHLAAISPASGGVMYRGMETSPYYLTRLQPNVYAYAGPNVLGTGRVSLTLSFVSETSIKMTMSLVLASEPNCQHVYYYSGTKNW